MMQEKAGRDLIEDYATPIERISPTNQGCEILLWTFLDFTKIRLERKEEKIEEVNLTELATGAITTVQTLCHPDGC